VKILQFVLTSQAKYIQPELRKQRDKIEANVVEKWMINARRMPELASHLAISGAFQVQKRLLLCTHKKSPKPWDDKPGATKFLNISNLSFLRRLSSNYNRL